MGVPKCSDGDIRLVNGRLNSEGRVEICFNGRWGTICDDLWGPEEARVVCRQQGFIPDGKHILYIRTYMLILYTVEINLWHKISFGRLRLDMRLVWSPLQILCDGC